eukprot:CAMPEP_0198527392 /NCGR_PEP_ID=MMETSP1462-20131121/24527_1 /TAXON_ID=1333877 /ORGANISM="Brandtodinium nutriculum, Strain RCC3387" /LENGTH=114 /DNA_ID=CAMNT_0044257197 /DNA_START=73 /DNA_END=414 /DNA_ORIENTATION=+
MAGVAGKASWACRSSGPLHRGKKLDPFSDFLINVAGDAKPLKQRVLETIAGQEDFYSKMRGESKQFRHVYLKEPSRTPDVLAEDRILFCGEGWKLKKQVLKQSAAAARRSASPA